MPTLTCKRVTYFSPGDEKAFFKWLGDIKAIRKWHGEGDKLLLDVPNPVSLVGCRELDALFRRYRINRRQLAQLSRKAR